MPDVPKKDDIPENMKGDMYFAVLRVDDPNGVYNAQMIGNSNDQTTAHATAKEITEKLGHAVTVSVLVKGISWEAAQLLQRNTEFVERNLGMSRKHFMQILTKEQQ